VRPVTFPVVAFCTVALSCVVVAFTPAAATAPPVTLDSAFGRFWAAKDPGDAAKAAADVVKTGAAFEEVFRRLRAGRPYSNDVPRGILPRRRVDFTYVLDVPPGYDASRRYQLRFQLHGGVSAPREASERRGRGGIGRLAGVEQIYVLPASWNEAPWWSDAQVVNLRAILDAVERTYNIDENHVVVSGVSDGGTGAYYIAMRDTTPYASFLPLNGYIFVLANVIDFDRDLFANNLRNKPFFAVNGGRDPLYPINVVEPSLRQLASGGVDITFKPQPQAGHDTSWWPDVKDTYEAFVREHPRNPLPDRLTWETADTSRFARAHWLQIDALGGERHVRSGRVDLIRSDNIVEATTRGVTQFTLLCSPDQFDFDRPVRIVVNSRVAFDGRIEKSVATLMKWAARDNDRTMLFGAELKIAVK
jgi:hypothetical protein